MDRPFSTPFAWEGRPAPEPVQPLSPPADRRRSYAVRLTAAALVLAACAAVSGALVGHALWSSAPQTVTVAGPGATAPSSVIPGGSFGGSGSVAGNSGGTGSFGGS